MLGTSGLVAVAVLAVGFNVADIARVVRQQGPMPGAEGLAIPAQAWTPLVEDPADRERDRNDAYLQRNSPLIKSVVVLSIAKCWAAKLLYRAICCVAYEAAAFCQRAGNAASNSNWPDRRTGIIVRVEPRHGAAVLNQSESA
jgi:hypothetical protein